MRVGDMIAELARGTDIEGHALLAQRTPRRTLIVLLTSDRGLAGAFNSNANKAVNAWIIQHKGQRDHIELRIVGKKGRDYFRNRDANIGGFYADVLNQVSLEKAAQIGREIVAAYVDGHFDEVFLAFNEFRSAIMQNTKVDRILPINAMAGDVDDAILPPPSADTIYEPNKAAVLDALLPMHIDVLVYRALLESVASEMGARMTAMDAATKNAGELLSRITLQYNRARQAIITTELMEITSGAEALKG
jgi:F-type H+-transporting ATPase subunit gamma